MRGKVLVDYHLHTRRCGHATGRLAEYVRFAEIRGLREIGFADHIPQYFLPPHRRDPGLAMTEQELEAYVREVEGAAAASKEISVRLGIEADYSPGQEKKLEAILDRYPFDYVLGSVHYLSGWGFDNPSEVQGYSERDIDALYVEYFGLIRQMATTGLFDVVAHPDLLKKFGYRPRGNIHSLYEETVRVIAAAGLVVEVNTAGLRQPVEEIYPAPAFLELCYRYEVPVTLGSDAHRPEDVGRDFDRAEALLRKVGYREVAVFEKRRRTFLPLG
ncbi:MAG: histidinol-phosphatase HisJ family protein [Bacillota bacterium]